MKTSSSGITKSPLKVWHLGTTSDLSTPKRTPTSYLPLRPYRATKAITSFPRGSCLHTCSVDCSLFEPKTDRILIPRQTNHVMLQQHMECKGCFSSRLNKNVPGTAPRWYFPWWKFFEYLRDVGIKKGLKYGEFDRSLLQIQRGLSQ
ncbi:hypothetical protein DL96DRAFT_999761 [Flagelloscypha sp. PMI_526]|nr:hypothetical protein DL96DRAFT_999761 [Flagelloscypha sp. PMI_526]